MFLVIVVAVVVYAHYECWCQLFCQGPSQEVDEKKETTPSPFEDGERREDKELQANVIMQNGLEDGGFRLVQSVTPCVSVGLCAKETEKKRERAGLSCPKN